ncbi:MAG TPA: AAA family ATPase [Thermoanaerobaculaceae bacterium]|nr:AAA family ATPase [Thermoanaerobaculaceae bacterium]
MRTVAVWTIKGGVGKTAAAVNLAALAAGEGVRTLLWDLDPQGAASFYFRVKARIKGGGGKLLRRSAELGRWIRATDFGALDLLPADFSYRRMDLDLDGRRRPERRLALKLAPLADDYDLVFLDCPPSVSLVSESVLVAADALLVPVIPTTLSLRSLGQVRAFAARVGRRGLAVLPFLSMVDRRKAMHREIFERCLADPEFLRSSIPAASVVEKMGARRAPVGAYAAATAAAQAFAALWEEVARRLGVRG